MTHRSWLAALIVVSAALAGCTTPYRPPVIVRGGAPFDGIAGHIERSGDRQVDVLLVHGMCTYDREKARDEIDRLLASLRAEIPRDVARAAAGPVVVDGIEIETRTADVGPGRVRFTALIWSPLTVPLKRQLEYDATGEPTDCASDAVCKPRRAALNGALKDRLLNDCLADALIYQGESRSTIRRAMANALVAVVADSSARAREAGRQPGSLVLVSDSLGSKIAFDALELLRGADATPMQRDAADALESRLATVFMRANQMPILGLADQTIGQRAFGSGPASDPAPIAQDSLQRLLMRKAARVDAAAAWRPAPTGPLAQTMTLVAFTDPNDLLSYRLLPSRYAVPGVDVADVLVSNASTVLGLIERPDSAHRDYRSNPDVARLIACGSVGSALCR